MSRRNYVSGWGRKMVVQCTVQYHFFVNFRDAATPSQWHSANKSALAPNVFARLWLSHVGALAPNTSVTHAHCPAWITSIYCVRHVETIWLEYMMAVKLNLFWACFAKTTYCNFTFLPFEHNDISLQKSAEEPIIYFSFIKYNLFTSQGNRK